MVGWHHPLNEHEFEQASADSEGEGSLTCCSPWGCKESDPTEQLNNSNNPMAQPGWHVESAVRAAAERTKREDEQCDQRGQEGKSSASPLSEMGASEGLEQGSAMTRHAVDFHRIPLAAVWRQDRRAGLVRRPRQERLRRQEGRVDGCTCRLY